MPLGMNLPQRELVVQPRLDLTANQTLLAVAITQPQHEPLHDGLHRNHLLHGRVYANDQGEHNGIV